MQKLNPAFTTITLSDSAQQKVAISEPAVTGAEGTITIDRALANDTYTVAYRVVSADGHPVQGSYRFAVADPTATASPDAPARTTSTSAAVPSATSASPAAATRDDNPGGMVLAGGAILLAMVIAAGAVLLSRRRPRRMS